MYYFPKELTIHREMLEKHFFSEQASHEDWHDKCLSRNTQGFCRCFENVFPICDNLEYCSSGVVFTNNFNES